MFHNFQSQKLPCDAIVFKMSDINFSMSLSKLTNSIIALRCRIRFMSCRQKENLISPPLPREQKGSILTNEILLKIILKRDLVWFGNSIDLQNFIPLWGVLPTGEVYLKQPGRCNKRKLTIIIKVSLFVTIVKAEWGAQ